MKRLEHQKDLFKKLIETRAFQKEVDTLLSSAFAESIWWTSEDGKKLSLFTATKPKYPLCEEVTQRCQKRLYSLLAKVKRTKKIVGSDCGNHRFGICIPVIQGDKIYGYIAVCHSKKEIPANIISLFTNFLDTLIRELQKELELAKLYKTIRPRAIALSTIHTIHRIISSTLNLEELLPKLARLCLQIFRAERCSIFLKGKPKRQFVVTKEDGIKKNKKSHQYDIRFANLLKKERILSKGNILIKRDRLCVPLTDEDVIGAICVMNKVDNAPFDEFDREILVTLSEQAAIAIKNAQLYKEQEDITLGSIKSIAAILDTGTPGTYKVRESFIKIALAMGRELHLNAEDLRSLHYAAILHDAGQIGFPDELLVKTDKLTGKEHSLIKRHPHKSVSIIRHLRFMKPVIPIILHHHENYNGTGYPNGLKAKEIPLGARIMAVAGAFNAMTTLRPYRQSADIQSAISEIRNNSGVQFDPQVVKAFLKVIQSGDIVALIRKGL